MKVIDLLNKIANGEEVPSYIKVSIYKYKWTYDYTREEYTYMQETGERLDNDFLLLTLLNTEIEVIGIIEEPKKIEMLEIEEVDMRCENFLYINGKPFTLSIPELYIANKINKIIDYINKENK